MNPFEDSKITFVEESSNSPQHLLINYSGGQANCQNNDPYSLQIQIFCSDSGNLFE